MKIKPIIILLPFAASIMGGVYFGLFSCGGYIWHKNIFVVIFWSTLITCFISQYNHIANTDSKGWVAMWFAIWVILIFSSYFVSEAVASSFYPDTPDSLLDFLHRFVVGLKYGPC